MSKGIYYGVGSTVIGPYHPDEIGARAHAQNLLRRAGDQTGQAVYELHADSWEHAKRRLALQISADRRSR